MPPTPRFIVFDLGGVVVRICRSWGEACERAGIPVREPERFATVELVQARHELADSYMSGKIGCDAFFAGISEATGGLYAPDEIQRIHDVWVIEDEPGIGELIERLNASDSLVTACLSNTNHAHWQKLIEGLHASPAVALLRRHLVSHEMGAVKPDQAIYAAAEVALGASPDQIAFYDDLEANVVAAQARGWHAHVIDYARPTPEQIIEHLAGLGVVGSAARD
jgi:FMN phosphatase YigB (HAD superfamily)